MKALLNLICIFILLLASGCGREVCKRQCDAGGKHCKRDCGSGGLECVEADDWGYAKVLVPADTESIVKQYGGFIDKKDMEKTVGPKEQYAPDYSLYYKAKDDYVSNSAATNGAVYGSYPDQHVRAIDSGQVILDRNLVPIVMTVGKSDQWTSWFGGEVNYSSTKPEGDVTAYDAGQSVEDRECKYKVTNNEGPTRNAAPSMTVFGDNGTNAGHFDLSPSVLWQHYDDTDTLYYLDHNFDYRLILNPENFNIQTAPSSQNPARPPIAPNPAINTYVAQGANDPQYEPINKTNGFTPCYFRYGMGLYVGFAPNDDSGNATDSDVIATYHIPDSKRPGITSDESVTAPSKTFEGQSLIDQATSNVSNAHNMARGLDGYLARGQVVMEFPEAYTSDQLFFKIIDRYYNDNTGEYTVKLKEGTRSPNSGPVEKIVDFFLEPVKEIMRRIYEGIVNHAEFIYLIRALLVLYMIIYGYSLIIGARSQEEYRKDAVIRMFKVAVIISLIGPDSWDFFNNFLFQAFIDGVDSIGSLLLNPWQNYDPQSPWYSMDALLARLFSGETAAKISSTLFSNFPLGIIFIIFLYLAMVLFLFAVIKAIIVYIIGFISIAILIALAPFFLITMLFEKTKHLTVEWFNSLVSAGIQILLLMAALGMFAALIISYMEQTIGYKVCWNVYADFDFLGVNKNISHHFHLFNLKFWMPDIGTHMTNIWMDVDQNGFRDPGGAGRDPEMAFRYEDVPYLDPIFDREKIALYQTEKNFLSFTDFLVFMVAVLLMLAFMDFVPEMAKALKGGSPSDTANIFGPAMGLTHTIMSGFKEFSAKAWNIGKSQNTKNLMDEVLSFWDGAYSTRGLAPPRKIKRATMVELTGAKGMSIRTREMGIIQDGMIKEDKNPLMEKGQNLLTNAARKSALAGLADEGTIEASIRRKQDSDDIRKGVGGLRDLENLGRDKVGGLRDLEDLGRDKVGGLRDGVRDGKNLLEEAIRKSAQSGGESLSFLERALRDGAAKGGGLSLLDKSMIEARNTGGLSILDRSLRDVLANNGGVSFLEKSIKDAKGRGLSLLDKALADSAAKGGGKNLLDQALADMSKNKGAKNLLEAAIIKAAGSKGGSSGSLLEKALGEVGKDKGAKSLLEQSILKAAQNSSDKTMMERLAGRDAGASLLNQALKQSAAKGGGANLLEKGLSDMMRTKEGRGLLDIAMLKAGTQSGGGPLLNKLLNQVNNNDKARNVLEASILKQAKASKDLDIINRFGRGAGLTDSKKVLRNPISLYRDLSAKNKPAQSAVDEAVAKAKTLLDKLGFADGAIDVNNLTLAQRREALGFIESGKFELLPIDMQAALYSALKESEKQEATISNGVGSLLLDSYVRSNDKGAAAVFGLAAEQLRTSGTAHGNTKSEVDAIIEADELLRLVGNSDISNNTPLQNRIADFVDSSEFRQIPSSMQAVLVEGLTERQKASAGISYAYDSKKAENKSEVDDGKWIDKEIENEAQRAKEQDRKSQSQQEKNKPLLELDKDVREYEGDLVYSEKMRRQEEEEREKLRRKRLEQSERDKQSKDSDKKDDE